MTLGAVLNVHRHVAIAEEPLAFEPYNPEASPQTHSVHYMAAYEEPPEIVDPHDSGVRHKGEEGQMGPATSGHGGLYALQGPTNVIPQMARNFDPEMAARNAGILGQMQQQSGAFLASPYGSAFALGTGSGYYDGFGRPVDGPGPLTLRSTPPPDAPTAAAWYAEWSEQAFTSAADDAVSTFSIDVDTGSYSLLRRTLEEWNSLPEPDSVRVEEMINYFDYAYPEPSGDDPVSITTEVGPCPWAPTHRLVHVGLQGKHVAADATPPRNLVFLVDVSGSMAHQLPMVVSSLAYLTEQLGERDRIALVVYAGAAGTVLPPTSGADKPTILAALEQLEAGGSTNGGEGIQLAYALAKQGFIDGGINRVVLATDGDFNVGVVGQDALVELIEHERETGVFLSVLGFGMGNYQDETMEQLADKGNGNYAYIDRLAEARKVLVEQAGATLVTIAKDVKLQVEFDPAQVERYRLVGYDNRILTDRDFDDDTKDAGDMGAGHTVTALYEVVPAADASDADALMELRMRYKEPDGARSKKVVASVHDHGATLAQTSDDFRFSAAVAGFGQELAGVPMGHLPGSLQMLRDLARDARGPDYHCRRAELVALIERASALRGHPTVESSTPCTPTTPPPSASAASVQYLEPQYEGAPYPDWARFVLEVLYLLPPLLAMPLFVMAWRRRRR